MSEVTPRQDAAPQAERCPVIDFDHHSAEFNADPHAGWMALKETPVAWTEKYGGYWVVSDHAGIKDVFQNPEVFTSARIDGVSSMSIPTIGAGGSDEPTLPIEVDPPYHTKVRGLLNPKLSPAESRKMQPIIEQWVTTCIDRVIEKGECDLLTDVVGPVPAYVTMGWLGFPEETVLEAQESVHHMVGFPQGSPEFNEAVQSTLILDTLIQTCLARRAEPRDDLISWLMTQELDGEPVTDNVIIGLAYILVIGGVDTTTSLAANAIIHLNKDRELRQRLIDEPELLDSATEEFLRFYPPLASQPRRVRSDFEYRGCPMQAGDPILVSRYGANFDEAVFDEPQEFRPDRFPNRHSSFGLGPHRCVGSHLARLMFREMLSQILRRMPDYELDEAGIAPYPDRSGFNGWTACPARFTPGPRSDAPS
ncbi:cytochrome P450 [Nocardioides sp. cx-173]|uniref:cytochrome P450 n=1 Tax=Nocardioides sp. cx-173 TaxID=2898796 RepID=UPI001E38C837|nr:cytochrome P450 [Nocardioides sp. cx-173]MCD4524248.1 cytochrome P450 [Nocardioides sp. cx-173]UGB41640.1 cytochrome P450 [Nocardioides sp. cx-173]